MVWIKGLPAVCLAMAGWPGLAAAAVPPVPSASPQLYLMTEASPPVSMLEGKKVIGSGTEKVEEIMARTGTAYHLELLPWKRAYTTLQQRPDACLFSTTRTPERDPLFHWVGPTDEADWVLLDRSDVWAASLRRGSVGLKRADWAEKIVPVLTFNKVGVYLACNRAVPAELIARMNAALDTMNRDGTTRRIDVKYERWLDAQPKP